MVNVHLKNRPDWFVAKTPHIGKVPLIEYQGAVNYESFVLQEYLEEKFPQHPRLSADTPEGRARDKYIVELSKRVRDQISKRVRRHSTRKQYHIQTVALGCFLSLTRKIFQQFLFC